MTYSTSYLQYVRLCSMRYKAHMWAQWPNGGGTNANPSANTANKFNHLKQCNKPEYEKPDDADNWKATTLFTANNQFKLSMIIH